MTPAKAILSDQLRGDTWPGMLVTVVGISLVGATARMQLKTSPCGTLKITWATGGTNDIVVNGGAGTLAVEGIVIELPARTYHYDLQVTLASGQIITLIYGTLRILNDITKNA